MVLIESHSCEILEPQIKKKFVAMNFRITFNCLVKTYLVNIQGHVNK